MDHMGANKDQKFNIAFTTLSDLEKHQKCDAELARHLMTKLEKSGAKKTKPAKLTIPKCTFVKVSEVEASELGESSTSQSKRKREDDNPQDRPFYQFL